MDYRQTVIDAADSLGLLDGDRQLIRLDSLMVVDLVVTLQDAVGVTIPVAVLAEETFRSIDTVAEMLQQVVAAAEPPAANG